MSIAMDTWCYECTLRRGAETARSLGSEEKATQFARALMELMLSLPEGTPSPCTGPGTAELYQKMYGLPRDRFREEKEQSNRFVLERLDDIRNRAEQAEDPVLAGLKFSILGNYLDFSALQGKVDFGKLDEMLESALEMQLDETTFHHFLKELEGRKKLLYVTDNAGEIGFDRVFAEILQKAYPELSITFCVRGDVILNDATREDAAAVGITFPVIDNGNRVGGTMLNMLSDEARNAMNTADVILAKGMGNVETMLGCGLNVYYAFLVKCPRFVSLFRKPMLTPMLVHETER